MIVQWIDSSQIMDCIPRITSIKRDLLGFPATRSSTIGLCRTVWYSYSSWLYTISISPWTPVAVHRGSTHSSFTRSLIYILIITILLPSAYSCSQFHSSTAGYWTFRPPRPGGTAVKNTIFFFFLIIRIPWTWSSSGAGSFPESSAVSSTGSRAPWPGPPGAQVILILRYNI